MQAELAKLPVFILGLTNPKVSSPKTSSHLQYVSERFGFLCMKKALVASPQSPKVAPWVAAASGSEFRFSPWRIFSLPNKSSASEVSASAGQGSQLQFGGGFKAGKK